MKRDRAAAGTRGERPRVLLVDDHPSNRMLLHSMTSALGYAAQSAENGVDALKKWKSSRFGLVMTDCRMPDLDGYDLARAIRKYESAHGLKRTPIIGCSANATSADADACLASGMDDYLCKPVEIAELAQKLRSWLPLVDSPGMQSGKPIEPPRQRRPDSNAVSPADIATMPGGIAADRDLLVHFRRINDRDVAMLEHAWQRRDVEAIARACHRMRGASGMVGMTALAAACEHLERAAGAHDIAALEGNLGAFYEELERVYRYIDGIEVNRP